MPKPTQVGIARRGFDFNFFHLFTVGRQRLEVRDHLVQTPGDDSPSHTDPESPS